MGKSNYLYERVVLKISGGMFGEDEKPYSEERIGGIADQIAEVKGVEMGLVVGGGNVIRGARTDGSSIDRVVRDYMGMLATVINGLALQSALENRGVPTRLMSALNVASVAEPYVRRRAIRHLDKGRVVIFVAGTGNPFFSTDSAAALRAAEIGANVFLKGGTVDGVYDADPVVVPTAKRYERIDYETLLNDRLEVMDATAVALCRDNELPIIVFELTAPGALARVLREPETGTVVG